MLKKTILVFLYVMICGRLFALNSTIDTEHEYIVNGTISAEEVEKQYHTFLLLHPEYQQNIFYKNNSKEVKIPSYIKFIKFIRNPHYIPSVNNKNLTIMHNTALSTNIILPTSPIVLDQGHFSTCVTMSTIGAIMSAQHITDKNNAPSASCLLQLMHMREADQPWDSSWLWFIDGFLGWDHSTRPVVGTVTEEYGLQGGCNDTYKTYEPYGSDLQKTATLSQVGFLRYNKNSTRYTQGNGHNSFKPGSSEEALSIIKAGLSNNSFAVFEFWYDYSPDRFSEMPGYFVWVDNGVPPLYKSGHAIFAYGYDDNIIVNGQRGVLYLRNSWGYGWENEAMTYDFFLRRFRTDDSVLQFNSK